MEAVVQTVDFWFWTVVPAIVVIGIVTAIPSAFIIGLMVTGKAKEERRS